MAEIDNTIEKIDNSHDGMLPADDSSNQDNNVDLPKLQNDSPVNDYDITDFIKDKSYRQVHHEAKNLSEQFRLIAKYSGNNLKHPGIDQVHKEYFVKKQQDALEQSNFFESVAKEYSKFSKKISHDKVKYENYSKPSKIAKSEFDNKWDYVEHVEKEYAKLRGLKKELNEYIKDINSTLKQKVRNSHDNKIEKSHLRHDLMKLNKVKSLMHKDIDHLKEILRSEGVYESHATTIADIYNKLPSCYSVGKFCGKAAGIGIEYSIWLPWIITTRGAASAVKFGCGVVVGFCSKPVNAIKNVFTSNQEQESSPLSDAYNHYKKLPE